MLSLVVLEQKGVSSRFRLHYDYDVNLASGQYCHQPVESFSPPKVYKQGSG